MLASQVPVCGILFLDGGYNKLLHFLVCLGHQVNRWALLHDGDVLLERFTDHLSETRQRQSKGIVPGWLATSVVTYHWQWWVRDDYVEAMKPKDIYMLSLSYSWHITTTNNNSQSAQK